MQRGGPVVGRGRPGRRLPRRLGREDRGGAGFVPSVTAVGYPRGVAARAAERLRAAPVDGRPRRASGSPGRRGRQEMHPRGARRWYTGCSVRAAVRTTRELAALGLAAGLTVLLMFLAWQVVEDHYVSTAWQLRWTHIARGVSTSLVTAFVVGLLAVRNRRERMRHLQQMVDDRTAEIERARAILQRVVDATPASLILLDQDLRVRLANRAAERVHGPLAPGDRACDVIVADTARCTVCPGCESLESGRPGRGGAEYTVPRSGEVLRIESYPVSLADGRRWVLLVEHVVTEQRKLEASLVHQEKMAAFGLLAAGIAHEMGNPLSSIEMHLRLLDESAMSEEDADSLRTVRQETARLRRTLRELVDFARRRRDEAALVSVSAVIDDALRVLHYDRRMRGVEIDVSCDPDVPPVHVVEDHLVQVVLNLVINALDAMPDGGRLVIDARYAGGKVSLRVRDTGCGMPRHVLDRCFEPLFTTKAAGKGTGLGLSICRDVLRAAGGDIELHSAPGRGTTAVVTLPAARVDVDDVRPARAARDVRLYAEPVVASPTGPRTVH
ncbi:MAG: PAS domain-containing protein [Deltaproteobacteria bacterium]|nr:MAG: PAS domain-containing protein [Deltaproteobacteria bacterium]